MTGIFFAVKTIWKIAISYSKEFFGTILKEDSEENVFARMKILPSDLSFFLLPNFSMRLAAHDDLLGISYGYIALFTICLL